MRTLIGTLAALLLCGCVSVAQQTPPAEGTGLGEPHTTNDSNAPGTPTVSPDQNQAITGTRGSTTGTSNEPGLSGSSGAQTGSRANSQGTGAASSSTSATDARRRASQRRRSAKKQPGQAASGAQVGSRSQSNDPSKGGAGQDKLLAPNMGPSTTESPGPSTGNKGEQKPPDE